LARQVLAGVQLDAVAAGIETARRAGVLQVRSIPEEPPTVVPERSVVQELGHGGPWVGTAAVPVGPNRGDTLGERVTGARQGELDAGRSDVGLDTNRPARRTHRLRVPTKEARDEDPAQTLSLGLTLGSVLRHKVDVGQRAGEQLELDVVRKIESAPECNGVLALGLTEATGGEERSPQVVVGDGMSLCTRYCRFGVSHPLV